MKTLKKQGQIMQADISNCSSTSPVIVPVANSSTIGIQAGGFSGNLSDGSNVPSNVTNCFASGYVTVNASRSVLNYSSGTFIGGFTGACVNTAVNATGIVNRINKCYAAGNVTFIHHSTSTDTDIPGIGIGGFVGLAMGTEISESFAAGNVEARKGAAGRLPLAAGGLVGFLGWTAASGNSQNSSITDCYATGNVTADNPFAANISWLYAGGLVGYMQISADKAVENSFASGSVSARNANTNSSTIAIAGGLVGWRQSGILRNNAALGNSVTAL